MTEVRRSGRSVHVQEDTFWRKDGSALPVSFSSAPIDIVAGTGCVVAFRDVSAAQAERERVRDEFGDVAWFEEIRPALAHDRFVLYAQPIVSTASGETVHHELLLRMLSPTGEAIAAAEFLPAAEKFGLINQIDRWVKQTIAEGVENERTLCMLRDFGVDFAQGYHLGRPQAPLPEEQD
jgi:predicted signal transduction protein with EAL and GGDEF domain